MAYDAKKLAIVEEGGIKIAEDLTTLASIISGQMNGELSAVKLAEIFIVVKAANEIIEENRKVIGGLFQKMSYETIPEAFERDKIKTLTTESGYRLTVSVRFSVSMLDKEAGIGWLRKNGMEAIVQETVNSQTLSAAIREKVEKYNLDPPDDIFKVSTAPYTSATAVKRGKAA